MAWGASRIFKMRQRAHFQRTLSNAPRSDSRNHEDLALRDIRHSFHGCSVEKLHCCESIELAGTHCRDLGAMTAGLLSCHIVTTLPRTVSRPMIEYKVSSWIDNLTLAIALFLAARVWCISASPSLLGPWLETLTRDKNTIALAPFGGIRELLADALIRMSVRLG